MDSTKYAARRWVLTHGFTLDPNNGPIRSGRQAVQELSAKEDVDDVDNDNSADPKNANMTKLSDGEAKFEDEYSQTEIDALYAHSRWPTLASLPNIPWSTPEATLRATESGRWGTRRLIVPVLSVSLRINDLKPTEAFVNAVEGALTCSDAVTGIRALDEEFASWGDVIPVATVVGSTIAATGVLLPDTNLEPASSFSDPPNQAAFPDLNAFIDTQLQIQGKITQSLKYHITGGRPDILLRNGFDAWLENTKTTQGWEIIKVTKVIPIIDILDSTIQHKIRDLYANRSLIFHSPSIGVLSRFGFDGATNGLRLIQQIEIGFSDMRIENISICYTDGLIAGLYGSSGGATRVDKLHLDQGEFITDLFIWPTDYYIASLQLVKNTGYVSPIYGATRGTTQPPTLLSGNGKALVGLSGGYDTTGVTRLQAVWRNDIEAINYKCTETSFVGGEHGDFWNDIGILGDRFLARISGITARSPGTGHLGSLQTTYTSLVGEHRTQQESSVHGTEDEPVTTWTLKDGQYITGVRGRHDGTSLCELEFITNEPDQKSPVFGNPSGNFEFNFSSPKTREGNEMMLHYMAGKSAGRVNSILFVWADLNSSVNARAGGKISFTVSGRSRGVVSALGDLTAAWFKCWL